MSAVARHLIGALSLALTLAACGDDDDCPSKSQLSALPCDIRQAACQKAVWVETARLREQCGATVPAIRVITREQFADETRQASRQQAPSWSDQVIASALRLVAFLPANTSASDASNEASINGVAAYYHKTTKDVTIIDDAASHPIDGTYTLSHEFTHALQDQRQDLDKLDAQGRTSDGQLAVDALVEGEAVAISNALVDVLTTGSARERVDWYQGLLELFLGKIENSAAPWTQAILTLPYPVGGRLLTAEYIAQGYPAIAARLERHPLTYVGWVEGGAVDTLPLRLQCSVNEPPPGYDRIGNDSFGGAGLLALYTRLGMSGKEAFEAARAWTGDAFTIYGPQDQSGPVGAVLAWRIGLRTPEDAAQLVARLAASKLSVQAKQSDREVYLTAGTDPAVLASWSARDACITSKGVNAADDTPGVALFPRSERLPLHAR